jgi:hypothetical protein
MSAPAGAEMLIGAPAEPPSDMLLSSLREGVAGYPQIRSAYLFQMMILVEGEEPRLTLGLELEDGADITRISNDLGSRAVDVLPEGAILDVYPLPDDMLETVAQSVEPLYERND